MRILLDGPSQLSFSAESQFGTPGATEKDLIILANTYLGTQANKSYFIHLDPSTQSAILSKQLVSMFEIIGMADKDLLLNYGFLKFDLFFLFFFKLQISITNQLGIPDRYVLTYILFDYVYIKNCLFIYKIRLISRKSM